MVDEEGGGEDWHEFAMPATEFLYRVLSGDLVVDLYEGNLPQPEHIFVPLTEG
jgi:hypothetical protein